MLSLGKNLEQAVAQFHCALQHTNSEPLRLFISLNLAIAYIKIGPGKESEVSKLVNTLLCYIQCSMFSCQHWFHLSNQTRSHCKQ